MMKRYSLLFTIVFLSILFLSGSGAAREWTIVGPRALGMGGANVAVANDASAGYWNPAAFGFFNNKEGGEYGRRTWSAGLDVGFGAQVHEELGDILNNISQIKFNAINTGAILENNVLNFVNLVYYLNEFDDNPNRALNIAINGGLRIQASHIGIAGYAFSDISAKGDLDLLNIAPSVTGDQFLDDFTNPANYGCSTITCLSGTLPAAPVTLTKDQQDDLNNYLTTELTWTSTQSANFINSMDNGLTKSESDGQEIPVDIVDKIKNAADLGNTAASDSGGALADNHSKLLFKGIAVAEIPVTYGISLTNSISLGATIKYMKARVYNQEVSVFDTEFSDALSDAMESYMDSQNIGIDIGLLYRIGDHLRIGLVGHNVNSPAFDMKSLTGGNTDKIKEKAQLRGGIALKPLSFVTVAMDYDMTKNDTTISDSYKSQNIGGGIELSLLKILQLRAGAYQNLAESDIGLVYTAGLGLNLWLVNIDLGASLTRETTSIDDNEIPKEVKAELALSALF